MRTISSSMPGAAHPLHHGHQPVGALGVSRPTVVLGEAHRAGQDEGPHTGCSAGNRRVASRVSRARLASSVRAMANRSETVPHSTCDVSG